MNLKINKQPEIISFIEVCLVGEKSKLDQPCSLAFRLKNYTKKTQGSSKNPPIRWHTL